MAVFVALTALDGTAVRINPADLCFLEPVPASQLPAGVAAGTHVRTVGRDTVAVQGTVPVVALAFATGGSQSLLFPLLRVDGAGVGVNPDAVAHIEPVPASLLPSGVAAACYLRSAQPDIQLVVQGTVAAVADTLASGTTGGGGVYTPALTIVGTEIDDVTVIQDTFRYQVAGGVVRVMGLIQVQWNTTPGAGEVRVSLPDGLLGPTVDGVPIGAAYYLNSPPADGGVAALVQSAGAGFVQTNGLRTGAVALNDWFVDFAFQQVPGA